jgi:membrane protein implicated in regulation of membrane protease activity
MDAWVLWLIAAAILGVGEILTTGFFLAPFAGGALVAALLSAVGAGTVISLASFLVVSVLLLVALRPSTPARLRTGTAALVGKTATVVEPISGDAGTVRIDGDVWTARAYDEDEVIESGRRVHVMEIRGATALVSEL